MRMRHHNAKKNESSAARWVAKRQIVWTYGARSLGIEKATGR